MPASSTLPGDLQKLIDELNENDAAARRVMSSLTAEQLNWQPNNGKAWSILQCFDHLILTNKGYLQSMWPLVRAASPATTPRRGPIRAGLIGGFLVRSLEPPVRIKTPAPSALMPPSKGEPDQVLAAYVRTNDELRTLINAAAELDLNSLKMANPFVKRLNMTASTALLLIAAHERRHTWQAGNVRKAVEASGQTTT